METQQEQEKVLSLPRIGHEAPNFKAVTTQGDINFPEDYKGKWVIIFSHPADFTPVCESEFITFSHLESKFEKVNCKLIGLSIDGLYSHIAWLKTIKDKIAFKGIKNEEVKFPLIEDITMDIAKKYGMIQPGECKTQAVRAVFFIDPKSIVRALIYYPLSLGRNLDEIYRALIAIQTSDKLLAATPNWNSGDSVNMPPTRLNGVAKKRMMNTNELKR